MKTLFVHLGTPKTGTSAIQWFLDKNSGVLKKKGYSYKKFPYHYRITSMRRNAHFLVGNVYDEAGNVDAYASEEIRAKGYEDLLCQFKECDFVVISDENLWLSFAQYPEYLRRLADWAHENDIALRIVVYLRPQDELAESLYKQHIQAGKEFESFGEYLKCDEQLAIRLRYLENIRQIEKITGKGSIIARKFIRANFPDGLVQSDFLDAIGLCMGSDYSMDGEIRNISFTNDYAEIVRVLNSLQDEGAPFPVSNKMFNSAALKLSGREKDATTLFDKSTRAEFLGKFREDNRLIEKEYFGGDGDLFESFAYASGAEDESDNGLSAGKAEGKSTWSAESTEFRQSAIKFLGQAFLDINDRLCEIESKYNC